MLTVKLSRLLFETLWRHKIEHRACQQLHKIWVTNINKRAKQVRILFSEISSGSHGCGLLLAAGCLFLWIGTCQQNSATVDEFIGLLCFPLKKIAQPTPWHRLLYTKDLFWFNAEMSTMQWKGNNHSCKMIGTLASCHKMHLHDYEVWWLRKIHRMTAEKKLHSKHIWGVGQWRILEKGDEKESTQNSFPPNIHQNVKRFAKRSKSAQKMESYEKLTAGKKQREKKCPKNCRSHLNEEMWNTLNWNN